MRYFLDTEFNGFGGALLSFALVPEDGGEDYYCILPCGDPLHRCSQRLFGRSLHCRSKNR